MNKKILKINSVFMITIALIPSLLFTFFMFYRISIPSSPNSWDDLSKLFIKLIAVAVYILNSTLIVSGICTLKYLKEKKTYKLSKISSIIGIILFCLLIIYFIFLDSLQIFSDYTTGEVNYNLKFVLTFIIFLLFIVPMIINIFELYRSKNNIEFANLQHYHKFIVIPIIIVALCIALYKSIVNINKIKVTEENKYTYSDFKAQLKNRNLISDVSEVLHSTTGNQEILALDNTSKYGYEFSSGTYTDSYRLSVNTTRKFPMFVYDSYKSLIKRSNKTQDYYDIGPTDWYICWYIYYINGKIYAAIGEESQYGSSWETSLSKTKYGVVISEEKNITVYNRKHNYFVKGGGILDTASGSQRTSFPSTTDIYNPKCMKIRTVGKINAETLDNIAKELSPQYWKVYKKE